MFRRTPLLPVAVALMGGIAAEHWLPVVPTTVWCWATAVAGLVAAIVLAIKRHLDSWLPLVALLLCILCIGGTIGRRHDPMYNLYHWSQFVSTTERQEFMAVCLTTTPVPRERSYMADAEVTSIGGNRVEGTIRVFFKKETASERLRYGDCLTMHAYIGGAKRSIYTTSDHYIVTHRDSTSLRARSEAVRMKLLRRMQRGPLVPREASVAEAMTLGWRADIEQDTQAAFRDAGIAHLLAVSGLHVGLVAAIVGLLCYLLPRDRKGRIIRGVVQLSAVWAFTLLTGMAPSTMRAALMFSLFIVSNIISRRTPKLNLLAATAIVTLALQPMLLFNVGWQLSYSAVAGILLARPVITIYRNRLWQAAAVSVSATLATLPVTLTVFQRIYPYFLIANIVIVPLSGLILGLSLAYMALPCGVTAWLLHPPLSVALWLVKQVSLLPHSVVQIAGISSWETFMVSVVAVLLLSIPGHLTKTNAPRTISRSSQ